MLSHGGEQQECSADHHHTAPNRNYYGGTYSGREGDDARRSWSQCVGLGRDLCLAVEKLSACDSDRIGGHGNKKRTGKGGGGRVGGGGGNKASVSQRGK